MIYLTYIGTHEAQIETERVITYALIGQLDIEAHRPPQELLERAGRLKRILDSKATPEQRLSPEEQKQLQDFERDRFRSRFEPKVLDWFEGEEAAEQAKEKWSDRINLSVQPVTKL